jgi:hypothetical protein
VLPGRPARGKRKKMNAKTFAPGVKVRYQQDGTNGRRTYEGVITDVYLGTVRGEWTDVKNGKTVCGNPWVEIERLEVVR